MKKSILYALIVLLVVATSTSFGQFRLSLGPVTGMNFNIHTGSDIEATGTGFGLMIGGSAVMSFSKSIGMISNIMFYDNRSGSTSKTVSDPSGASITIDNSISLAYLQLEELFMYKLPTSGFYFFAGPVLGFNIEGSSETTAKITTPGFQFGGGGTTQKSKSSLKDALVRFELKLGAGYDFPITRNIWISPTAAFGFGLTKVVSDVNWRVLTLQAGATMKFVLI